jgi:hypothetical protein
LAKKKSTGARTDRSMAARRRLSVVLVLVSVGSIELQGEGIRIRNQTLMPKAERSFTEPWEREQARGRAQEPGAAEAAWPEEAEGWQAQTARERAAAAESPARKAEAIPAVTVEQEQGRNWWQASQPQAVEERGQKEPEQALAWQPALPGRAREPEPERMAPRRALQRQAQAPPELRPQPSGRWEYLAPRWWSPKVCASRFQSRRRHRLCQRSHGDHTSPAVPPAPWRWLLSFQDAPSDLQRQDHQSDFGKAR